LENLPWGTAFIDLFRIRFLGFRLPSWLLDHESKLLSRYSLKHGRARAGMIGTIDIEAAICVSPAASILFRPLAGFPLIGKR
jgi:hypothetical protein